MDGLIFRIAIIMPMRSELLAAQPQLDPKDPLNVLRVDEGVEMDQDDDDSVVLSRTAFLPDKVVQDHVGEIKAFVRTFIDLKTREATEGLSIDVQDRLFQLRMAFYLFVMELAEKALSSDSGVKLRKGVLGFRDRIRGVVFENEEGIKLHPDGRYWAEVMQLLDEPYEIAHAEATAA
jgi:hypothetical protein